MLEMQPRNVADVHVVVKQSPWANAAVAVKSVAPKFIPNRVRDALPLRGPFSRTLVATGASKLNSPGKIVPTTSAIVSSAYCGSEAIAAPTHCTNVDDCQVEVWQSAEERATVGV
jgi:hypothetical protein